MLRRERKRVGWEGVFIWVGVGVERRMGVERG